MEMGKRIRQLRTDKGVTQEALANALGVTSQAVSRWETNVTTPDVSLLPDISMYFGVTIDELFNPTTEEKLERLGNRLYPEEEYFTDDEFRSTLAFLKDLEETHADNKAEVYTLMAYLYANRVHRDSISASHYARKAMRIDPEFSYCVRVLPDSEHAVISDWDTANHSKTISFLTEMVEQFPEEMRYHCALLNNLIADRRVKEAEAVLAEFHKRFGLDAWVRTYRAKIALADCRKDDAVSIIEETYKAYADDEGTVFDIAGFYGEICEYEKAIEFYKKSYDLQESPKSYDALVGIARTYEIMGKYDEAARSWEKVKDNLENDWGIDEGAQVTAADDEIKRLRRLMRK